MIWGSKYRSVFICFNMLIKLVDIERMKEVDVLSDLRNLAPFLGCGAKVYYQDLFQAFKELEYQSSSQKCLAHYNQDKLNSGFIKGSQNCTSYVYKPFNDSLVANIQDCQGWVKIRTLQAWKMPQGFKTLEN